jgi:hypothetical protein
MNKFGSESKMIHVTMLFKHKRFKTRIGFYLCFNKPIRKKTNSFHALLQFTDKPMSWEASISMKHEIGFKFWNVKRRKALQHHTNFTALEALICVGRRIAERTASCYMLLLLKSRSFSVLSCCQAGFFNVLQSYVVLKYVPELALAIGTVSAAVNLLLTGSINHASVSNFISWLATLESLWFVDMYSAIHLNKGAIASN